MICSNVISQGHICESLRCLEKTMPSALYEFSSLSRPASSSLEPNSVPKKIKFTKIWVILNCLQLLLVWRVSLIILCYFTLFCKMARRTDIVRALSFAQCAIVPLLFYGTTEIINDFQQNEIEYLTFEVQNSGIEMVKYTLFWLLIYGIMN